MERYGAVNAAANESFDPCRRCCICRFSKRRPRPNWRLMASHQGITRTKTGRTRGAVFVPIPNNGNEGVAHSTRGAPAHGDFICIADSERARCLIKRHSCIPSDEPQTDCPIIGAVPSINQDNGRGESNRLNHVPTSELNGASRVGCSVSSKWRRRSLAGPKGAPLLWGTAQAVKRRYARAAVEQPLAAKVLLCITALCVCIDVATGGLLANTCHTPTSAGCSKDTEAIDGTEDDGAGENAARWIIGDKPSILGPVGRRNGVDTRSITIYPCIHACSQAPACRPLRAGAFLCPAGVSLLARTRAMARRSSAPVDDRVAAAAAAGSPDPRALAID